MDPEDEHFKTQNFVSDKKVESGRMSRERSKDCLLATARTCTGSPWQRRRLDAAFGTELNSRIVMQCSSNYLPRRPGSVDARCWRKTHDTLCDDRTQTVGDSKLVEPMSLSLRPNSKLNVAEKEGLLDLLGNTNTYHNVNESKTKLHICQDKASQTKISELLGDKPSKESLIVVKEFCDQSVQASEELRYETQCKTWKRRRPDHKCMALRTHSCSTLDNISASEEEWALLDQMFDNRWNTERTRRWVLKTATPAETPIRSIDKRPARNKSSINFKETPSCPAVAALQPENSASDCESSSCIVDDETEKDYKATFAADMRKSRLPPKNSTFPAGLEWRRSTPESVKSEKKIGCLFCTLSAMSIALARDKILKPVHWKQMTWLVFFLSVPIAVYCLWSGHFDKLQAGKEAKNIWSTVMDCSVKYFADAKTHENHCSDSILSYFREC